MTKASKPTQLFGRPGDVGYRQAVAAYDLSAVVDPGSAMAAHTVDEVREAVAEARRTGVKLVVMTTGHSAALLPADLPALDLIKTELSGPIRVDRDGDTVTFPAGATARQVATEVAKHGRAILHGSSGEIGLVGYLLGGGLSFYGRQYGVSANSLVSVRLVTADGQERFVDADSDPELFWALRGGGGGFGVVTEATWRTVPVAQVITGLAAWPAEQAADLTSAWGEWTRHAPRAATTSLRLIIVPPGAGLPPDLVGRQLVAVDGTVLPPAGDLDTAQQIAEELLAPLRAMATPVLDTWHQGPALDALDMHLDPPTPIPAIGDGFSITDYSPEMAEAWLRAGRREGHRISNVELRQLGGAFAEPAPGGGVFDHTGDAFVTYDAQVVTDPAAVEQFDDDVLAIRAAMQPWLGGFTPPTFVSMRGQPDRGYAAELDARVRAVRERVDPDGMFSMDVRPTVDTSPL